LFWTTTSWRRVVIIEILRLALRRFDCRFFRDFFVDLRKLCALLGEARAIRHVATK
jgi:hypothetical protein